MFIGYGAPALVLLIYSSVWCLYLYGPPAVYAALLTGWGVPVWPYPFFDLETILQAVECARQGVDVTLSNACMGGGSYPYSPLFLKLAALPLGTAQLRSLGLGGDALLLLSLFALPPPRRWSEFWQLLLAAVSSSTLFAIERANLDVAIYLLVFVAILLLLRGPAARLLGYAVVQGLALVKFYPICLMVLAARERPGRFLVIAVASTAVVLLFVAAFFSELGHVVVNLPTGMPLNGMFSARDMPLVLALFMTAGDAQHGVGLATRVAATSGLLGLCALLAWRFVPTVQPGLRALPGRERLLLLAGAALIAGCFFAGENNYYRGIFLLLTLPGLWSLERGAPDRAAGKRFRFVSWVVVGLLWSGFYWLGPDIVLNAWLGGEGKIPILIIIWAVRELFWWGLVSFLVSVVLCFLWDTPITVWLRRRVMA